MLDALIGGVSYWAIGWGLSYGRGSSSFLGESDFFSYGLDPNNYPLWFFQFVFAATAATILSGAIAERVQFFAYFVYSIVITGKIKIISIAYHVNALCLGTCFIKLPTNFSSLGLSGRNSLGMAQRHQRLHD